MRDRKSEALEAEFLEEKIGHAYFEAIRELDLASCRIREIEGLSGQKFRCLSYLNLDHNQLTGGGLAGLTQLPHLSVLRLNHNRISDLLPGCIAAPEGAKGCVIVAVCVRDCGCVAVRDCAWMVVRNACILRADDWLCAAATM